MENKVAIRQPEFSLAEMERLSTSFAKSSFFADAKDAAQALVKIQAGRELGLPPVYAMTKIFFVQGRLTLSAEAMGALIKTSRDFDYHVDILDNEKCTITFFKKGQPEYVSTFTLDDAKRAELTGKEHGNWAKWPRPMLMSKALSQGARIVCPHIISGAYTPEDFGIETDEEGYITQPQRISQEAPKVTIITESRTRPLSDEDRAAMQAAVDEADGAKQPAKTQPNASVAPQDGLGTPSGTKQVETVVPPPNDKIFIDMEWLNGTLDKLKYQRAVSTKIKFLFPAVVIKDKNLVEIISQLSHEQQDKLVKELRERAESGGITLD